MASTFTICIILFAFIGILVSIYLLFTNYSSKIDFNTENIDGKPLADTVREYRSFSHKLNDKNAKALFFGLYLMRKLEEETLLKIDKMDKIKISKLKDVFKIIDEKIIFDYKFCTHFILYKYVFETFSFEEKDKKDYLQVIKDEIEIIKKNESVISEIMKISDIHFTEDCAEYLKTKKFFISEKDPVAYSAIELIFGRYTLFASYKDLNFDGLKI
ncbi:hypothetical protein P3W45_001378 [Vairimorpha bombi]|jgi:hypothetical protein